MKRILAFLITLCFTNAIFSQAKGDLFRILSDEYSALTVRNDLMRDAKKEILLCTYIIEGDEIGYSNLKILSEAAQRGVQVRIILDGLGKRVPKEMLLYMKDRGVQIKIYNKKNWKRPFMLYRRLHGKMLIVDGQYCLIGGRNLNDQYYRMDSVGNFLDREVLIRSDKAVDDARRHFNEMWNHEVLCTDLKGSFNPADRKQCQLLLDSSALTVKSQMPLLRKVRGADMINPSDAMKPTAHPVQFVYPGFTYLKNGRIRRSNRIDRRVTHALQELVAAADSTLEIESAYFMLTRSWFKCLKAAHKRGVRIRVITNSATSNDLPIIQAVYANRRGRYRRAGIQLYEYCGDRMVHLKTLTIDKQVAMIGSYNLDKTSERRNTEVAAWVKDPFVALQQQKLFEKYLAHCQPPGGECPASTPVLNEDQKKRKRKVKWLRFTLAPLVGLVL
ncbi:MAG: phosphatidylserine/phosphatidylglycerophosphate/cardiolipin synthase family protein [Lewinellaceae bacterium]|nr:phosphatidylserine/phosphatidylglycerophosphate/cardiolipin synthase family protein [Lewinellaceae bacterium]